jgi:hypothetical protein
MKNLEELFKIPKERSAVVFWRYAQMLYLLERDINPNFDHLTCEDKCKDFTKTFWIKYYRENEDDLRLVLSEVSGIPVKLLPKQLAPDESKISGIKGDNSFHKIIPKDPQFKYYYSLIFAPYYNNIKSALLEIDPLFGSLADEFLLAMVVYTIYDYQRSFREIKLKYKEVPAFYECLLYFGFNILHLNEDKSFAEIENEPHKIILSMIYLNYVNKGKAA